MESDSEEEGGGASQEGGGDHSEGSNKGSDMEDDWHFVRPRLLFMFHIVVNTCRTIDHASLIKTILIYTGSVFHNCRVLQGKSTESAELSVLINMLNVFVL